MLRSLVAVLLLLTTSPVTAELIERSVHHRPHARLGLETGDASANGHHEGDCHDERDCTPWYHNCLCHARTFALVSLTPCLAPSLTTDVGSTSPVPAQHGRDSDRPPLPPPIA